MTTINKKSGILSWTEENILRAPMEKGVFVLRTSPTLDSVKSINASENLKNDLMTAMQDISITHDVVFFDWYTTMSFEDAEILAEFWREKYNS